MDAYGYDDNRRLHWLLSAAAVLGGAALLAVGFGLGRASAPAAGPGRAATASGQAGPGPTRTVNGVPVGYAHTEAGAVAAATEYGMVLLGPLLTQPDSYRAAVDVLAAPTSHDSLRDFAEAEFAAFQGTSGLISYAQQGHSVVVRSIPLAYHVETYDSTNAVISVWAATLIAVEGFVSPRESWATGRYALQWAGGDWKLLSNRGGADGPVPLVIQPSAQSTQLPPQLRDYRSYNYAARS